MKITNKGKVVFLFEYIYKGPVLKSFMRQVAIIEDHDFPWKFWILSNVSEISKSLT